MCSLQAGGMKKKTGRGGVRYAQFLLQTNQSGKSLPSWRRSVGGVRERRARGVSPAGALPHGVGVKCPPSLQPTLAHLCIPVLSF